MHVCYTLDTMTLAKYNIVLMDIPVMTKLDFLLLVKLVAPITSRAT